jgi:hypothetical protein
MAYISDALVELDVFINALFGGLPDETISSRVRRVSLAHPTFSLMPGVLFAKALNAFLNWLQKNHGLDAEEDDVARADQVIAVEDAVLDPKPEAPSANKPA